MTGSLFSIPSSFRNICNFPLLGMAASEQGNRVLLYSATDICVYIKELDMWRITCGIVDVLLFSRLLNCRRIKSSRARAGSPTRSFSSPCRLGSPATARCSVSSISRISAPRTSTSDSFSRASVRCAFSTFASRIPSSAASLPPRNPTLFATSRRCSCFVSILPVCSLRSSLTDSEVAPSAPRHRAAARLQPSARLPAHPRRAAPRVPRGIRRGKGRRRRRRGRHGRKAVANPQPNEPNELNERNELNELNESAL